MTQEELKARLKDLDGHERTELLSSILRQHVTSLKKTTESVEHLLDLWEEQERQRGKNV